MNTTTEKPAALPSTFKLEFWDAFTESGAAKLFHEKMAILVKNVGEKSKPSEGQVDAVFSDILQSSRTFEILKAKALEQVTAANWSKLAK